MAFLFQFGDAVGAGGGGGDVVLGGDGDDRFRADGGDDLLVGGRGTDEVVYAGARTGYAVFLGIFGGVVTVRDLNGAADGLDEGTDTLFGIERLRFAGGGGGPAILRASASAAGEQGDGPSSAPSLSADGGRVAFSGTASNLVPGDTNGFVDVFVKDLSTGTIALASTTSSGEQGNFFSYNPSLSADDGHVAFTSSAGNLAPGDISGPDVFVKVPDTGEITRASTSASGDISASGQGSNISYSDEAALSANGGHVAFSSPASNLVPNDTNRAGDVFVKDLATGAVTLASASASGEQGNGFSGSPSFSADGTTVAFRSIASNLVPGDANGTADVFVKDLISGAITLVSISAGGEQGNSFSGEAALSADGNRVAFYSFAGNLVPGDTDGVSDAFVKDLGTGEVTLVGASASAAQGATVPAEPPSLSADGSRIAFISDASDLVPGDTNGTRDVFVKDLVTGAVTLVSASAAGEPGNGPSGGPSLSADGTKVGFSSTASNLVPGDTNGTTDVFVRDLGGREAVYALGPDGSLTPLAVTPLGGADTLWG